MKRLLLLWAMFLCSLNVALAQFSGSGSGTESDPYLIFYADQLTQVRNFLNKEGVYFKLMTDIDLTDWIEENSPSQGWQPIGVSTSKFKGVFDGNNHTISNLNINRPSTDGVGLFGYAEGATFKNIVIDESTIIGKGDVGTVAGNVASSTFSNCIVTATINAKGNTAGGIAGSAGGTFADNKVTNTIINGNDLVGGIAGYSDNTSFNGNSVVASISGQDNVGSICGKSVDFSSFADNLAKCNVNARTNVGGIVGNTHVGYTAYNRTYTVTIKKCAFYGNINGFSCVGGILGYFDTDNTTYYLTSSTDNCVAFCDIEANGDNIGGIVGKAVGTTHTQTSQKYGTTYRYYNMMSLSNNYHSGDISGGNNVGGIIGYHHMGQSIKNICKGSISGKSNIGGIVGYVDGDGLTLESYASIKQNVSALNINSGSNSDIGRIIGKRGECVLVGSLGTSDDNLALSTMIVSLAGVVQEVADDEQNGTSIGQTGLKLKANYVAHGWDFNNDWVILETETYPYKPWQTAPPYIESGLISQSTTITGKSEDGGTVYIEIGDSYKTSTQCNGNQFSFTVPALQSGKKVRLYAISDGKWQSPYTDEYVSYPGKGTEAEPYRVYTASDLQGVYKRGYYKQMNDIDLTSWVNANSPIEGWPAIGKNGISEIYYDGGGHTVTGLWCNTTTDYNGLFSNFPGGYIRNLTIKVADGRSVSGGDYTGILIGRFAEGTINNVAVEGNVASTGRGGGILGSAVNLTMNSVQYSGSVSSSSANAKLGGIAGETSGGKLTRCFANASIDATGDGTIAGALVGVGNSDISVSYAQGSVSLTGSNTYAGGLIGQNSAEGTVKDCYSLADTSSKLYAAGIVAYNYGAVSNSYAKGNVSSQYYGAGAIGYNDGAKASINGCVAGNPRIDISDQSGWSIRVLGGFKNSATQPGEDNYALNTMILSVNGVTKKVSDNILDGYAKTEKELESQATYKALGWDFSKTWYIDEGHAWPLLHMKEEGLVDSIVVTPNTVTLEVGSNCQITATVYPTDAINKTLKWSSSDRNVAKVSNGLVTAVAVGNATISVLSTDGTGKFAKIEVMVIEATGIKNIDNDNNHGKNIIYDLQGRRVNKPSKGLYIVNGKKIILN